ncbi:MAG: F0F1 ATP synthase subunit B [Candidatus Gastranaerophilales bacterium]|nr:F0F1 ATP synthase subunit B [Candidatus Gastranaerophilales bacterium]
MLKLDINLLFTVINILILYGIVRKFLFGPVQKILDARQAQIDDQYASAQEAQSAAEELKRRYEDSLKTIDGEKETLLNDARDKADQEYKRVLSEAKAQAERIVEDARKTADAEQEKRMQQAQEQIADLVVAATAKVVASRQNAEADRELYNQFIAKTGEKA